MFNTRLQEIRSRNEHRKAAIADERHTENALFIAFARNDVENDVDELITSFASFPSHFSANSRQSCVLTHITDENAPNLALVGGSKSLI